ncbi:MFS transporter [Aquibium oceanicum]|uniref:Major facilitator superfamily (MFS) profile domain-containing protein n=1 Tax=Aquibium oceanicum TaxID=1670800 RepID=A0A1L3ST75_9HYPH|nr:MFS transporter [Aquibium oceanicum]APH72598.1 hypothetical protein BSQ44_15445 [Aquibium oceanicum]
MAEEQDLPAEGRPPYGALAGVIAAATVFGAAQGLSYPLFTLLMQKQGFSPSMIGASAAMMPLGIILSAPLVPSLVRLAGGRTLAVSCAVVAAVCFLAIALLQNWFGWFVLRFLVGFAVNPLYILGEVWALALAPAGRRGRVMGVFNTVGGAGYAAGPLALSLVGPDGWPPFLIGTGGFLGCAAILASIRRPMPGFEEEAAPGRGILWFAATAPALLVAVGVAAADQQGTYALIPLFGAGYGLPELALPALVTSLALGNILLQMPLGLAAERFGGRAMMIACASAVAACAALLPLLILTPLIWPLLVIMGGVGYGVYTMTLVELGDRFTGSALVAGNSAFALMWGVGGMVGPPGAGLAMEWIGPSGLPAVILLLCFVLIAYATYRARARGRDAA